MSFFIRENKSKQINGVKRKLTSTKTRKKVKKVDKNEEISSESDDETNVDKASNALNGLANAYSEDEDESLTAQEKRLKLAKLYLDEIKRQEEERSDKKEFNNLNINQRLKDDLLQQTGRLRKSVAGTIAGPNMEKIHRWRMKDNRDCVTTITLAKDDNMLYAGTKKGFIFLYSIETKVKLKTLPYKRVEKEKPTINSLAISHDNKFLAVAQGNNIIIRNGTNLDEIHVFKGHSNIVTGVVFRKDTHQLYSASKDRTVKVWSCDEMLYIETLFGHQSEITSIDSLYRERAVTSGGFDNTLRVWKLTEDSQLVYNGPESSIDCVKLIDEEHFVSCGNDGSIQIWGSGRKKPLTSKSIAHGIDQLNDVPNWIICVAPLLNSDLIASGSSDGFIRLWKITDSHRGLEQICEIPMNGFVNSLTFSQNAHYLIAAVGREHRLGRWWNQTDVVNSIVIIPLVRMQK